MAAAVPAAVPLEQGSELSVTGKGPWIVEIGRRLWQLPAEGGKAEAITPPEQWIRRPALSPDGNTLAYQALIDGAFQIVTSDPRGGSASVRSSGPWHHLAPAWSPDGSALAFASNRSGPYRIWLLPTGGTSMRTVSTGIGQHFDPAWDPASGRLAWVSESAGRHALLVQERDGSTREVVRTATPLRAPAWRPDGTVISFTSLGAQGPRLDVVILSRPPVVKTVSRGERAAAGPALWIDKERLLYAADGGLRLRELASPWHDPIPILAEREPPPRAPAVPARRVDDSGVAATEAVLVLRPDRVLDAEGKGWLEGHDIVIGQGRIGAVSERTVTVIPDGAAVIDLPGTSVVPGLVDLDLRLPPLSAEPLGRTLLAYGITTAQLRPGTATPELAIAGRWLRTGRGPRMLAAASWCGGNAPPAGSGNLPVGAVQVCAAAADPAALSAAAFIDQWPTWSAVAAAARSGRVHAVLYPGTGPRLPLADAQESGPLWFQDTIDSVLQAGVAVIARTADALPAVLETAPDLLESRQLAALCAGESCPALASWPTAGAAARSALRDQRRVLGQLAAGGAPVVAVSDAPDSPYGLGLHATLRLLESAGLDRPSILASVTRSAAASIGLDGDLGRLAPSQVADLLVVRGDPLARLADLLQIERVMLGGRFVDTGLSALPALEKFTTAPADAP